MEKRIILICLLFLAVCHLQAQRLVGQWRMEEKQGEENSYIIDVKDNAQLSFIVGGQFNQKNAMELDFRILLMPDLPRVGIAYSFVINELADFCEARDVAVWAVAAGSDAELAHWNDIAMAHYPIYQADDSEVKMLARGNAAVMYVDARNVVQWKRTLASINPSLLDNAQNDVMRLNGRFDPDSIMMRLFTLYMVGLALLLIVNRGSLALWRLAHRGRKATPQPSEEQS